MIVSGIPLLRPFYMPEHLIQMLRITCVANDNEAAIHSHMWGVVR